jgi:hypothetical protein
MKLVRTIAILGAIAASCVAQDVRYNFDKTADFSKYKTYKWVQIKDAPEIDQLTEQQLKQAIEEYYEESDGDLVPWDRAA